MYKCSLFLDRRDDSKAEQVFLDLRDPATDRVLRLRDPVPVRRTVEGQVMSIQIVLNEMSMD